MFKMFGSVKDVKRKINTQGIGLGLVISQMIVEHFGGQISFESEHGQGTTFTFTFETEPLSATEITEIGENRLPPSQANNVALESLEAVLQTL